jgi:hypothetical protein
MQKHRDDPREGDFASDNEALPADERVGLFADGAER